MKKQYLVATAVAAIVMGVMILSNTISDSSIVSMTNVILGLIIVIFSIIAIKGKKITKVEYTSEFNDIYKKIEIFFDEKQNMIKKKLIISTICFFASSILLFVMFFNTFSWINATFVENMPTLNKVLYFSSSGILALLAILSMVNIIKIQNKNRNIYETVIIPTLVNGVEENLIYNKKIENKAKNVEKRYLLSGFEEKKYDKFYCEDFVIGQLNNEIPFEMVDIDVKRRMENQPDEYEEAFKGIFAVSQVNKDVCEEIKISPDKFKIFDSRNRMQIDSSLFEEKFDIYSTDRMAVARIFTVDLMEEMIEFYEKYKIDFEITIKKNIVFLRFFTGNMFEYKNLRMMANKRQLFLYYNVLKLVIDVTKGISSVINEMEI